MLSLYGKNEWLTVIAITLLLLISVMLLGLWYLSIPVLTFSMLVLWFFRDPERHVPPQRGIIVSPADGVISSIHRLEQFDPFGGPAICIRVFMNVFNIHVNRSPCHGSVSAIQHKDGLHKSTLNPSSMEHNESNMIVLVHPIRRHYVAAVRQVAGLLARTIVCSVREGQTLQRGMRIGMIKLGSTTELYVPEELRPELKVEKGQKVYGGITVLAVMPHQESPLDLPESTAVNTEAVEGVTL